MSGQPMKLTPQDVEAVAACVICGSRQHSEVSSVWSEAQKATLFATSYCHTCGSTFRSRRPRLDWYETGSAAPFREIYDKSWEATRVYRYHHYVRAFRPHIKPGASILDIGSNTGVGPRFLEGLGYQLFGVEQDLKRVELSRALVKHPDSIFGGSFERYPVERRFDVIMLAHVLEHLQTPRQLLGKVRSLLADDGVFYVEVPDLLSAIFYYDSFYLSHMSNFTKTSLAGLLEECGFEVIKDISSIFVNA